MNLRKCKPLTMIIFLILLANLATAQDKSKKWDIEKIVTLGLQNSQRLQTERENLLKKQLYLKSLKFPSNISLSFSGNLTLTWPVNQNLSISPSANATITIPILSQIQITSGYSISQGNPTQGNLSATQNEANYGNFTLGIYVNPLQTFKEISQQKTAKQGLDEEELTWLGALIKTELNIRRAYITVTEAITQREIAERKLKNVNNLWLENKKRLNLGLLSEKAFNQYTLEKMGAEENLIEKRENEYIALSTLSHLINLDLSGIEFQPLPQSRPIEVEKWVSEREKFTKRVISNNIQLRKARLKLEFLKESLDKMKNSSLPEVTISPEVTVPVGNLQNWTSKISMGIELSLSGSNKYSIESKKIEIAQQERSIISLRHSIIENLNILLYQIKLKKYRVKQLSLLLDQKKQNYEKCKRAYTEGKLLSTQLEAARINLLKAQENLQEGWDNLWLLYYRLKAAQRGYIGDST